MDLITVIVPVYNVKKYLKKCLDSIKNQSYTNLEILLIDDGSTDGSEKICEDYAKKDKRFIVYHKENGGSSSARNLGLDLAKGSYITFVDADDYIDSDMYELLYNACVKNDCDISWCNKYFEHENGKVRSQSIYNSDSKLTQHDAFKYTFLSDSSLCDKLFKSNVLKEVRYVEGELYEDIMPLCYAIGNSQFVYFINKCKYHYIQRAGSNVHHFDMRKANYIKNAKEFIGFVLKKYPDLSDASEAYYILVLCTLLSDLYLDRKEYSNYYNEVILDLKSYKKRYLKNNYISFMKKIMCFFIMHRMINISNFIKRLRNRIC